MKDVRLTLSGDDINIRSMCVHPGYDHGRDRAAADRNVVCRASIKTSSSLSNWMHALHFFFYRALVNVNRDQQVGIYRDLSTCPSSIVYRVGGLPFVIAHTIPASLLNDRKLVWSHLLLLFTNSCERGSACIDSRDQSEIIWQVRIIVCILSKMCVYALSTSRGRGWQVKGCLTNFVGPPPHSLLFWMVDEQNSRGGIGRSRRPGLHRTGL